MSDNSSHRRSTLKPGPQPADIFCGVKMIVNCVVLFSDGGQNDCNFLYLRTKRLF